MAVSIATYWYRCWFIHNHNIFVHKNYCDWLTSYWNFMSENTTHSMYDLSYLINSVKERLLLWLAKAFNKSQTIRENEMIEKHTMNTERGKE